MKKTSNTLKIFLIFSILLFFTLSLIFCSDKSSHGIRTGLTFCSELLIPSLFPFIVLSSFIVKSSLTDKISEISSPVTKALFNLPGCTASTILIGLIGGYPTGARGIRSLLDEGKISKAQAQRMLFFLVGAGPGFVISMVGTTLLKSFQAGVILFTSQVISSLALGVLLKSKTEKCQEKKIKAQKKLNFSDALVLSCKDATITMLNMCSLVVFFCSFLSVVKNTFVENSVEIFLENIKIDGRICKCLFSIIFEVTSACKECYTSKNSYSIFAFLLAWAGVCVHFQIYSIVGDLKFSKLKFTFFRLLQGIIAWIVSNILFYFFPIVREATFQRDESLSFVASSFTSGSVALILLCACFLSTLTPKIIEVENEGGKYEKVIWKKC